jgi:histidine triad (HIT) family protein
LPKQHDDCLFCSIAREGAYVHESKGFVAINDINPQAPVHVLVIPLRHVDTFREVDAFDAKESKRMLEFVAETAEKIGLRDYRVLVNVGPSAGQTVFHLHWHIIGGRPGSVEDAPSAVATAEIEEEK